MDYQDQDKHLRQKDETRHATLLLHDTKKKEQVAKLHASQVIPPYTKQQAEQTSIRLQDADRTAMYSKRFTQIKQEQSTLKAAMTKPPASLTTSFTPMLVDRSPEARKKAHNIIFGSKIETLKALKQELQEQKCQKAYNKRNTTGFSL